MKKYWPFVVVVVVVAAIAFILSRVKVLDISAALPSNGQYPRRDLSQVNYLVLHHSASTGQGPLDYARYHVNNHGWPGIGYHFVIQPGGTVYQTQPLEVASYHTKGHNTEAVGICLSGNFVDSYPTAAQEQSLRQLIARLRRKLPNRVDVRGHGEFVQTSCPGNLDPQKFA